MSKENRLYRRLAVNLPARCALLESPSEFFSVTVSNIGPEGVGFLTDKALGAKTEIYFYIDFGDSNQIEFSCEVRWSERAKGSSQFRVGAKILDADKSDLEKFVRFYCEQMIPTVEEKKKILIIDDEKEMTDLLRHELIQSGYDVVCSHDGEDGFLKYVAERPDLIILDIMLPKLNGYEVCRKIRREKKDNSTPILMLTAKKGDVDRIVGGVIGAQKYLTKPFEAEHLLHEIAELLKPSKT